MPGAAPTARAGHEKGSLMSINKDSTNPSSLHALREEFRNARLAKQAVTVNVEDAIFTRLIDAEELLAVALGLFTELAKDKNNWLFNHEDEIAEARWALHSAIHDRKFA